MPEKRILILFTGAVGLKQGGLLRFFSTKIPLFFTAFHSLAAFVGDAGNVGIYRKEDSVCI